MFSSLVLISYALSALASPVLLHNGNAGNSTLFEDIMVLKKNGACECHRLTVSTYYTRV